jgi:uncharacterized protein DUF3179
VFRAAAQGRTLHFDTVGVIGANEVFGDRETGSHWQQSTLEAISGPLKGRHLDLYPFLLTSWGEWHRLHPNTSVLKPLPGYADRIPDYNRQIREGLSGKGAEPDGVVRHDDRLPPKAMVFGLDVNGAERAFPRTALQQSRVINETLGGEPIVVVHQPGSDTTTAFRARLKGQTLKFTAANPEVTELTDAVTRSRWDAYGNCTSGKLAGARLDPLILEPEYWFAWSEFHPKTTIYSPSAR